jgi:hypothetical protein
MGEWRVKRVNRLKLFQVMQLTSSEKKQLLITIQDLKFQWSNTSSELGEASIYGIDVHLNVLPLI